MKLLAAGFFLAMVTGGMARANIGDTLDQLRQHYGAYKAVAGQALFQHGRFSISVYFDGSTSGMEVFTPTSDQPKDATITTDDINTILAAQADGLTWDPTPSKTGKPTWLRSDHKLLARLSPAGTKSDDASVLVIMLNEK